MDNTTFDDQLKKALNGLEPEPSDSVWKRIEGQLSSDDSFDDLICRKLNNINPTPSSNVWEKIDQQLTQSNKRISLPRYLYPAVAAAIALLWVGAWMFTQQLNLPTPSNEQIALMQSALPSAPLAPTSQTITTEQEQPPLAKKTKTIAFHKPIVAYSAQNRTQPMAPISAPATANATPQPSATSDKEQTKDVQLNDQQQEAAMRMFLSEGKAAHSTSSKPTAKAKKTRTSNLSLAVAGNSNNVNNSFVKPGIASSLNRTAYNIRAVQLLTASQTEIAQPTSIQHHLPITGSLLMQNRFSKLFALEFGLSYTLLTSELNKNGSVKLFEKQSLHYVGVPVSGIFTLWENKWLQAYAKLGGSMEVNVYGTHDIIISSNNNTTKHRETITDSQFQFSTHANIGIGYNLTKKWQLSIEPGVVYYFNNQSRLITYRQDQPLNFSLTAALKYRF